MAIRVAINGFGRIGRIVFRAATGSAAGRFRVRRGQRPGLPRQSNAHLLKYDSVHGRLSGRGHAWRRLDAIVGRRARSRFCAERDPTKLPWGETRRRYRLVMECTGIFTKREQAAMHLAAGAKRVLVSAPATGADLTVVYGVNHHQLDAGPHRRLQRVLHHQLPGPGRPCAAARPCRRRTHGYMTTIHAFTGDQMLHG